jgi:hypothetical protein
MNTESHDKESHDKEKRILVMMRKALANIVKDTTPEPGLRHPLKTSTIEDIRECFKLISARERELAESIGLEIKDRPRYADEPQTHKVVSFKTMEKSDKE